MSIMMLISCSLLAYIFIGWVCAHIIKFADNKNFSIAVKAGEDSISTTDMECFLTKEQIANLSENITFFIAGALWPTYLFYLALNVLLYIYWFIQLSWYYTKLGYWYVVWSWRDSDNEEA